MQNFVSISVINIKIKSQNFYSKYKQFSNGRRFSFLPYPQTCAWLTPTSLNKTSTWATTLTTLTLNPNPPSAWAASTYPTTTVTTKTSEKPGWSSPKTSDKTPTRWSDRADKVSGASLPNLSIWQPVLAVS